MKILFASDIHGDLEAMKNLLSAYEKEKADRLVLLGDLLYHGPRNDLPEAYNPKEVISLLNLNKDKILAVRGNCDTEVDQMVLEFPILADYAYLSVDGVNIFLTHGHKLNPDTLPPLKKGDILMNGHTHVLALSELENGCFYLNPGSVALPKQNNPKTYMIFSDGVFKIKDFDGNVILTKK